MHKCTHYCYIQLLYMYKQVPCIACKLTCTVGSYNDTRENIHPYYPFHIVYLKNMYCTYRYHTHFRMEFGLYCSFLKLITCKTKNTCITQYKKINYATRVETNHNLLERVAEVHKQYELLQISLL